MAQAGIRAARKWAERSRGALERLAAAEELWGEVSLHSPLLQSCGGRLLEPVLLPWPTASVGGGEEHAEAAAAVVQTAVDGAATALGKQRSPAWRAAVLGHIGKRLAESETAEEFALMECWSGGKPMSQALDDVAEAARCFSHFSSLCLPYESPLGNPRPTPGYADTETFTQYDPVGVCGAIVPFNFPLLIASWKVAPAIAFGNALILKPSEYTPLTAMALQCLFDEAVEAVETSKGATNVSRKLFQVVPGGREIGEAIAANSNIDLVAFTGSTFVGRQVQAAVAVPEDQWAPLRRCTLELGGNAPAIVCADANIEETAEQLFHGIFMNAGQNCCAVGRVLVHEEVDMALAQALHEKMEQQLKVGDPFDKTTTLGPVVSKGHALRLKRLLHDTQQDGIALQLSCPDTVSYTVPGLDLEEDSVTVPVFEADDFETEETAEQGMGTEDGWRQPRGPEFDTCFVKPSVSLNVGDDSYLGSTEAFGPLARFMRPFIDVDEAAERANSTHFGLAGGVFTADMDLAADLAAKLDCGNVWVNTWNWAPVMAPFAGRKASGFGSNLGVEEARATWTNPKQVTLPRRS